MADIKFDSMGLLFINSSGSLLLVSVLTVHTAKTQTHTYLAQIFIRLHLRKQKETIVI